MSIADWAALLALCNIPTFLLGAWCQRVQDRARSVR